VSEKLTLAPYGKQILTIQTGRKPSFIKFGTMAAIQQSSELVFDKRGGTTLVSRFRLPEIKRMPKLGRKTIC
jgi:hypothetical protein